jgi:hypothetical protein
VKKPGRTAKRLPQFLDNQLKSYAIAAGATGVALLALAHPSAAEVIYTPVHAPIPSRYFYSYLDINGDGIPDFGFINFAGSFSHAASDFLYVDPLTGGVITVSPGFASALPKGQLIGSSGQFVHGTCFMAGTYLFAYFGRYVHNYYGPWNDVDNRFLGVSFSLDGEVHYGWIRMNVNLGIVRDVRAIVTGYAYESVANAPIRAGQTSGSADSDSYDQPESLIQPNSRRGASLGMLAGGAVFRRHGGVKPYDLCRAQHD